ncbi:UNVERIFIED_CONTAM: hypothetical protein HDU68_005891 [Siphonaria sp. JEL0065]|nr:hypothetical protein HDU68_005891 [Siphonaria sp. JEL0065]
MRVLALIVLVLVNLAYTLTAHEYAERIYVKGQKAYADRDFGEAVKHFSQLQILIPDWKDNYYNWAMAELFRKQIGEAFKVLDIAVERFPDDGAVYMKYCGLIASMLNQPNDFLNVDRHKSTKDLVDICIKATTLLPNDQTAWSTLASLLTLVREYKTAISVFQEWLVKFKDAPRDDILATKTSLAETLVRNGEYERAYKIAKEAMDEDPSPLHVQKVAYVRKIGWPSDSLAWKYQNQSLHALVATFPSGHKDLCPQGRTWRVALNYSDEAINNPSTVTTTLLNPKTAYQTYGRKNDPTFVGPILPQYPRLFHERFIYLVHIKSAFLGGHPGIVHGNCTLYSGVHHINVDLQTFPSNLNTEIITITHRSVHIIQHQVRNYYHWMLESLPKLLLLKKHVLDLPENKDMRIMVPERGGASCIDNTLDLPEFDSIRSRFIYYEHPTSFRYYFPKGLHQIQWLHPANDTHKTLSKSLWSVYWAPKEVHLTLRDFFHNVLRKRSMFPGVPKDTDTDDTIVYVSRINTVRGFPNELALLTYLSKRFGSKFKIHNGREGLLEQVAIFAKARVVVGSHGAGLVNFVFTQPGAAMVMVPMNPHVEFCFGHLVAALGGIHYVVSKIPGAHYHGTYGELSESEMQLMGDTIEKAWKAVREKEVAALVKDEL